MVDRAIAIQRDEKIKEQKIFVTYDVDETGGGPNPLIYRVAEEVSIRGFLTSWEIGDFKVRGTEEVYGVLLKYRSAEDGYEMEEIVDTSPYAQNVQVFVGSLPKEYQGALQRSA
jgi:hypothetical protein